MEFLKEEFEFVVEEEHKLHIERNKEKRHFLATSGCQDTDASFKSQHLSH